MFIALCPAGLPRQTSPTAVCVDPIEETAELETVFPTEGYPDQVVADVDTIPEPDNTYEQIPIQTKRPLRQLRG